MVTIIFGVFLIVGIVYSFFNGNISVINDTLMESGNIAIDLALKMVPLLCLWLGVMKIAERSGLMTKVSRVMSRVISPLFPELKKDSMAISYLGSNIVMNMLGLGNAATPFGLKAMNCIQEDNPNKDTATRSMITFLVMNTASVTLIPTTVISFRVMNGSNNPTEIVFACIIVTVLSCLFGLIMDRILYYIWRIYD
jgi:spore maturation protein A